MIEYTVIISDLAAKEFSNHLAFLANVSKSAAVDLKKRMMEALRKLETMPNRFPFFQEPYVPNNKYHKMFVQNWYLVLYQIRDERVYVDYILDCRQDYTWLIK